MLTPARNRSLRGKLPLVVASLTAGALLIGGVLAYLEVRRGALDAAESRLESILSELGTLSLASQATRQGLEQRIAGAPGVRAALQASSFDSLALSGMLDSLRTPTESGMPVLVLRRDGGVAFRSGSFAAEMDPDPTPPLREERAHGPFRSVGDRVVYWLTIPVIGPTDEAMGWIAQRRTIGNPQAAGTITLLLGRGTRLLIGLPTDSVWVDVAGGVVDASPDSIPMGESYRFHTPEGEETLAFSEQLAGAPWIVLADMPMREVMARPRTFAGNMMGLGTLLLMLAMLLAWRAGCRVVGPLEEMVAAAAAIAAGDNGKRVRPTNDDDEIGRLATTFNSMADRVTASEEALRMQLEEAKSLANRLEEANLVAENARAEAQRASNIKSDFLATMSHEIRTPINVVVSYVDLMKAGAPDPPTERQRHYLERMDESCRLLDVLLSDLLVFFRLESGQMQLEMGKGSAAEAIRTAVSALEPTAATSNIALATNCPSDGAFHADPKRVQQIVLNLLSNAIKFTPDGGSVTINCASTASGPPGAEPADGAWVRIDVEDTGVGIPADEAAMMFEPFVRGRERKGRTPGTGLGLAISQRLALMMSGRITVHSTAGAGARFTLWLREDPSEATAQSSPFDQPVTPLFPKPKLPMRKRVGFPGGH